MTRHRNSPSSDSIVTPPRRDNPGKYFPTAGIQNECGLGGREVRKMRTILPWANLRRARSNASARTPSSLLSKLQTSKRLSEVRAICRASRNSMMDFDRQINVASFNAGNGFPEK